jgi:hypothetical protein
LNVIEAPKSVEGVKKLINPPDNNKGSRSTSNLSPITTYSQRSVSAISDSTNSPLFPITKKTRNN